MPYRYLEDIAIADVAFEAWGNTAEAMFAAAADATLNVMTDDITDIRPFERRNIDLKAESMEMLLFDLIQELIFYKDAEQLLLRISEIEIFRREDNIAMTAVAMGERIDPARHRLNVDVKAVTLHRFAVIKTGNMWKATIVLDI